MKELTEKYFISKNFTFVGKNLEYEMNGYSFWFYNNTLYLVPSEAPNEHYCVKTNCKTEADFENLFKALNI